ncbi:MAG: hypothetical protein DMF59_16545 [Acidobacteria bacterium]|nr:MAG: hypothetical protein DMF59_16545 [Acidobacteriota bacterium]
MSARQIPPESWKSFLDSFTRQHQGWLVRINDDDPAPLETARVNGHDVEIRAGTLYNIANATEIRVVEVDESAIDHVEIAGPNEKLTIQFRTAINPALVDGM